MGLWMLVAGSGCGPAAGDSYDLPSSGSYLRVRQDPRDCAAPRCGGYFVARLNQEQTLCQDGTRAAECYVAEADWTRLGPEGPALDQFRSALFEGRAVVRAEVEPRTYTGVGDLGALVVIEGWSAATAAPPSGTVYRVYDTGLQCVTSPCFSLRGEVLHGGDTEYLSGVDLAPVSAARDDLDRALEQLSTSSILVAGAPVTVQEPGFSGPGYQLIASQFYLRTLGRTAVACGGIQGGSCPGAQICDIMVRNVCGGADLSGVCVTVPEACAEIYQPVCGCDGQTYENDCSRLRARVQLDHEGPCGEGRTCGGIQGTGCPSGQFCDVIPPRACNGADLPGICRIVSEVCAEIHQPVCGCDGRTYGNNCSRRAARVQLDHEGACEP